MGRADQTKKVAVQNGRDKYKELSKNTLLFSISSFGSKLIGFLFVPIYTNVLSTAEYGSVDLATTTAQLLTPFLTLCIEDGILRFSLDSNGRKEDTLRVAARIILPSTLLLGFALVLVQRLHLFDITPNYYYFLYATYIMGVLNNSLLMYLKAADRVQIITVCGLLNTLVACISNILLLLVFKIGVNGYMISYVSGYFVANMGMLLFGHVFRDIRRGKYEKKLAREMVAYSMPMAVISVAWWINYASDRYILTFFCGTTINGIYAIAYKIPHILNAVNGIVYQAWSISSITEFDEKDKDGFISNIFSLYLFISVVCCSGIMLFNILLARILYANEFFIAWKYVPPLLVGSAFYGLAQFEGCFFTAARDTKTFARTMIISAIINTVLNFVLIPFCGAFGAALATMIAHSSTFFIRWFKLKRILELRIKLQPILISFFLLLFQCAAATISKNFLYQLPAVFALLIVNRKSLLECIHLFREKFASKIMGKH